MFTTSHARRVLILALTLALGTTGALAQKGAQAYQALGLKPQDVLTGTVLKSRVTPSDGQQVVCIATYLTGKDEKAEAVNVRLGVFDTFGEGLVTLYTRDFGKENGGYIANGDLLVMDIDRDGINEIIVSFDDFSDPLIKQRLGEIILHDGEKLDTGWAGLMEYDATKAARDLPVERRDRYVREFDWGNTLRTRGATLFFKKKVISVAGERLPEPRTVEETFELRGEPKNW
jgi:hypothetical protein